MTLVDEYMAALHRLMAMRRGHPEQPGDTEDTMTDVLDGPWKRMDRDEIEEADARFTLEMVTGGFDGSTLPQPTKQEAPGVDSGEE